MKSMLFMNLKIGLDFLEEDIDLVDSNHVFVSLEKVRNIIKKMIDTFQKGRILHEGLNVVLTGPPNAGKSSLMNGLLKENKSIVEDLIVAAHSNAKSKLKSKTSEEISKAAGNFSIPGFKWPL